MDGIHFLKLKKLFNETLGQRFRNLFLHICCSVRRQHHRSKSDDPFCSSSIRNQPMGLIPCRQPGEMCTWWNKWRMLTWFVKTENLSCNLHICEFYKRRRRQKLEQTFDKIQMWCLWLCRHFKVNLSMHIAQSKNTLWDQIKVRYICVLTTSFTEWILKTNSNIWLEGLINLSGTRIIS